ncbi:MAG: polysaccharide pyruvyl transferase family protein [Pleomorphochaeta sp.]
MKKIGILTYYYKNYNYGGLLQAYALRYIIESMGYNSEQISFKRNSKKLYIRKLRVLFKEPVLKEIFQVRMHIMNNKKKITGDSYTINTRAKFDQFIEAIPHSRICDSKSISKLNEQYDAFIVGSDQVWNPLFATDEYFLSFADNNMPKISYAASIRINNFEQKEIKRIKRYLSRFDYISVREERAKKLLASIGIDKAIDVLPDPTFLLSKDEWDFVSTEEMIKTKYVMVYLVRDANSINQLKKYARANGLKIILVEDLGYYFEEDDVLVKIKTGVGPKEFISLIKYAEMVVVNSFHGTVFSIIYNKPFYVYGDLNIDDRKKTLLENMGLKNQIIPSTFDFLRNGPIELDFTKANNELSRIKEEVVGQFERILENII